MTANRRPAGTVTRRDRSLARGLVALVSLLALVVVPPLALATFVGNPLPERLRRHGGLHRGSRRSR
jgi:hypothetical protein